MEARTLHNDKARFETRLSSNQKAIFERAANLGGYRSLSDFVVSTVQEKARKIIREHETILASQKDSEFFFEAILNAEKPNNKLVKASQRYQELLAK
ncbi:hypothetical protein FH5T_08210 [Draconibacterium orientale]|nr:hypothetical protein FH5T_08210 [Draconibacterium orientale]